MDEDVTEPCQARWSSKLMQDATSSYMPLHFTFWNLGEVGLSRTSQMVDQTSKLGQR